MIRVVTENGRCSPYIRDPRVTGQGIFEDSAMTRNPIKTHFVWLTVYAALFSAIAFAGPSAVTGYDPANLSPLDLDARPAAVSTRPGTARTDI